MSGSNFEAVLKRPLTGDERSGCTTLDLKRETISSQPDQMQVSAVAPPVGEATWITQDRERAQLEGLTFRDGNIWYRNPEGLNGAGEQFSGTEAYLPSERGLIQDVGLSELTHLQIKVKGRWGEVPIALGQILSHFKMPTKRYGPFPG